MTTEEIRREDKLEDAIEEYHRVKAMYDEWWSKEKLDYLEDALAFVSGEPLPIGKVGRYYWLREHGLWEVCFTIEKAINAYKERREYWHNKLEETVSKIACIVPRGQVVELDGETIEGISEAI